MFGINAFGAMIGAGQWLKSEVARRQQDIGPKGGTREGIPVSTWRALPDSPTADPSKLVQQLPN
ncbi:hypothetical protein QE449_003335 [Rhodococcus sp. SORGH_AS303]|nr:hypothetical protein [Rhodococcus sp. SORGH_AS_0303]